MSEIIVDPRVSRMKFDREVALYRQLEGDYIRRGWWMVRAEYPTVIVVFGTDKLKPPAVVFGARIDFTNYDLLPPSVQLVHPMTLEPYKLKELPTRLPRRLVSPAPQTQVPAQPTNGTGPTGPIPPTPQPKTLPVQEMMQAFSVDAIPFLCLPGVREYHSNPGHTGDSWFLYRRTGVGRLNFILEQLHKYGVKPMHQVMRFTVHFEPSPEEIPE